MMVEDLFSIMFILFITITTKAITECADKSYLEKIPEIIEYADKCCLEKLPTTTEYVKNYRDKLPIALGKICLKDCLKK